jgi:CheY-like chemotaxis protein
MGAGKVLFADDEEILTHVAESLFGKYGYDVVHVFDGEAAVDYYRAHRDEIAFVVLDVTMPKMDGITCFYELKKIDPDVRAIFSTAHHVEGPVLEGKVERLMEDGVVAILEKPYTPAAVAEAVWKAVDGKQPSP